MIQIRCPIRRIIPKKQSHAHRDRNPQRHPQPQTGQWAVAALGLTLRAIHRAAIHTGPHHAPKAPATDSVTLSDSAKSLASARAEVEKTPDVREQKVADIKQQLSDGTYQVSARVEF